MNKRIKIRLFTRDDRFEEFFLDDSLIPCGEDITVYEKFILDFVLNQGVLISLYNTSDINGKFLYIETDNENVFFNMYNYLMKNGVEDRGGDV